MNTTFTPQTLAGDLSEMYHLYARFFATLDETIWDKPVKGSPKEWNLHETIAHLVALNGAGLESIKHTLRGETYTFIGLDTHYDLNIYNRKGIDEHLNIPMKELCAKFLDILYEAAGVARSLRPDQAEMTMHMAIYNRSVRVDEALSIIIFHVGLAHSAQVAEPAGLPPLWKQFSPGFRHRVIGRAMSAFSLLYRRDIGGSLRDMFVFRIDGPSGGEWYVEPSPHIPRSGESIITNPGLVIHMRDTAVFYQMLTSRLNFPLALISGAVKLRGNLRMFFRMDSLFSVDAKP